MQTYQVGDQKRLLLRARVRWPVTVETTGGPLQAQTRDISPGGAHIHCTQRLDLNEPLELTIQAPNRDPLKVAATVIWTERIKASSQPRIVGVRFTRISPEDREFLQQLASEQFKKMITKQKGVAG